MSKTRLVGKSLVLGVLATALGCGDDKPAQCKLADPVNSCHSPSVCEDVAGKPTCVAPVIIRGKVTDPAGAAIPGALVMALDANDAPASGTATTDAMGMYELRIPSARVAGGAVMGRQIKLRAAAAGFDPFPLGARRSLPIEISTATQAMGRLVVQTTATDIVLFPVANRTGLGSIAGTVKAGLGKSGALVVAEAGPGVAFTSISDGDGKYEIFNVPAGTYTVRGYAAGLQLVPAMATVPAGMRVTGVDLAVSSDGLGTVSGNVNIVNAAGGLLTSVVLVVESTFNDILKRGEVPPGLRAPKTGAPDVANAFMITDVPDGAYVVLAAFENDSLVRDPDTSIGGTQIQRITIGPANRMITLAASFKITEALAVVSPGAGDVPDPVMGTPTFVWKDDSSEDKYSIEVFDSRGTIVWMNTMLPKATGADVSVTYAGQPLTPGVYYQFRATSWKDGIPISQTEDLRGVFVAM